MTADNTHCPSCNAPLDGTVDRSWNDEANAFLCVPCSFHLRLRANNQSMSDFQKILDRREPETVNWYDTHASGSAVTILLKNNYGNLKARYALDLPIQICSGRPAQSICLTMQGERPCQHDRLHFLDSDDKEILNIAAKEIFSDLPVHQFTEMKAFTMRQDAP